MLLDIPTTLYFLASFAGVLSLLFVFPRMQPRLAAALGRLSSRAFHGSTGEIPKFALVRIAFGILLTWRAYDITTLLVPVDHGQAYFTAFMATNILTGVMLMTGLFTQWSLLFLMIFQWQQGELVLGTSTLGNDIAAILALVLFWTNSGRYLSLDAVLIRRCAWIRPFLLYFKTAPTPATLRTAKTLGLFSYWLVCLFSLSMHLNEPAWMTGFAGPQLLSSNFMSGPYLYFSQYFEQHEWAVLLARIGLWMMLPWYLLVFPAALAGGWARLYAIGWGLAFFFLSKFVLILGWLAEIELLLWAALFWSHRGIDHAQRFAVAFDDTCNLCDRTVQFIRRVDLFDRVILKPASQNKEWLAEYGISYARAMEDLHGVDLKTGHISAGYQFYIQLSQQVVLLWPLYPILLLGKWLAVGPAIYRYIAARRKRLFGVCTIPLPKTAPRQFAQGEDRWQPRLVAAGSLHVMLLGFCFFLATPAPFVGHKGWPNSLALSAHIYGIAPINVFNHMDLKMNENWFTLELIDDPKTPMMIPVFTSQGTRLSYNRSDRIIFGDTVRFRRASIGKTECLYPQFAEHVDYPAKIYMHHRRLSPGEHRFRYTQYYRKNPDETLILKNRFVLNETTIRCTVDFTLLNP